MRIDLKKLIQKRLEMRMQTEEENGRIRYDDEMLRTSLENGDDEILTILPVGLMERTRADSKHIFPELQKYHTAGIFQLGHFDDRISPYLGFNLYLLSKNRPNSVFICEAPHKDSKIFRWDNIVEGYHESLEKWINTGRLDDLLKRCVNEIPYKELNEEILDVRFYTKKYFGLKKALKKQKSLPLSELADVIRPCFIRQKSSGVKLLRPRDFLYPLEEDKLSDYGATPTVLLQKGDIVVFGEKVYLITETPKSQVTVTSLMQVVRTKSDLVTCEYLFFYLNDPKFKTLISPLQSHGFLLNTRQLGEIPVLLPNTDVPLALNQVLAQKYRDLFDATYRPHLKTRTDYYTASQKPGRDVVRDDVLLDELLGKCFREPHKVKIMEFINDNLKEMDVNIQSKAYRSAVIMAGSVLEAFLIDWTGEMDHKNYFQEPFRVTNDKGRLVKMPLSLNDAIDRLRSLNKKWAAFHQAKSIMNLRNSVHPSVFLRDAKSITKVDCLAARDCLRLVVESRYENEF